MEVASAFLPMLVAVGITAFNLEHAANCASGDVELTVSINRSHCPKTMSGSVYYWALMRPSFHFFEVNIGEVNISDG